MYRQWYMLTVSATRNEATGFLPFYLVFGRHPRLPIDLAMGVESNEHQAEEEDHADYTQQLREWLESSYKIATSESNKSAKHHKRLDRCDRGGTVEIGDRMLVRNVSLRNKLANRWKQIYT